MLSATDITKSYRTPSKLWRIRRVLGGASLDLRAGEIVGLTGENGTGKSTLVRILAGLLVPDGGRVMIEGRLGYCPQEVSLFDALTPEETFEYYGVGYGLGRCEIAAATEEYLSALHFETYRRTPVAYLSEGTKQKLSVALALMHRPSVVLLDEPYAGFDYLTYLALWELIAALAREGRCFLIVTHLVHERARFHRVLRLSNGRCLGEE